MSDKSADAGAPRRRRNPILAGLQALLRTRITAGLLTVLPIYVTILLLGFVFGLMRDSSQWTLEWLLETQYIQFEVLKLAPQTGPNGKIIPPSGLHDVESLMLARPWLGWSMAILSVMLTIILLYTIGLLTANIVGRRIIQAIEVGFDKVPLVKTIYRSSKQILKSFAGDQTENFQRVALVPFPQERMRCVGFITATFRDSKTNEELATVFIPTTPNPTTGYLQIVRRADLTELDWSVEDAVRTIMSGGILRPDYLTIVPQGQNAPGEPLLGQQLPPKLPRDGGSSV